MTMLSRVMMIAGEASGDLHGAGVVRELKRKRADIEVFGVGGDRMKKEGMELVFHISSVSFMGFVEVVKHLSVIRKVERELEGVLDARRPEVVVLIDYPGFNLRFARKVKARGIKVLYYISPQVWAWHKGRVKKMKSLVDRMKVVFPFEVDLYRREGVNVEFVGHPLVESLGEVRTKEQFLDAYGLVADKKVLGLFPGSRAQEIEQILPVMIRAARRVTAMRSVQVAIGVAPNLGAGFVRRFIPPESGITLVENGTHDLMCHADAAIVTSGTATLETGWFGTPMVVVYKTSPFTFFIGRILVDVEHIGLVNIVAGRKLVPELVQHEMTAENMVRAIERMLDDADYSAAMRSDLSIVKSKLGGPGASIRVADGIIALGEAA
ncbi:MAG TPA: lipid-A-disaccharide synthase [Bacteroidota bacterium]|nr:lipid-A-disaccharide synthase [Bacteroidota bacterium]